ncbi:MAG: sigma-70 family RNA polymerase sigma factor [Cyanomargarita calcarea GSE-NOS-MK-12-04C]|jgi:RNA polymerase sigma-B factor|uniref:Sigma-70 family RNA polymerase sigma factor n=1 Tax=Cyanomargarita calcarea GSE-NOS-MK-12-04C TaxID=2839659 RepID=A0A951QL53_9CYAN|nr:sigma-70 family RNA polymerase sigma factor [Cyanomargarita calcarea GSE-NOS-MK-12-04C]
MKNIFILFFETRSLSLRNYLVEDNIGLARKVAHVAVNSSNQPYEDMLCYATIGLTKAVERYNPLLNDYFSSFAMPYIRGEIQHYLRDKVSVVRLHRKYQELATKKEKASRKMTRTLGRIPTKKELIEELQISTEMFEEIEIAVTNRNNQLRLDMPIGSDDLKLGDALPARESMIFASAEQIWLEVEKAIIKISPPMARKALALIYLDGIPLIDAASSLRLEIQEILLFLAQGVELLSESIDIPLELIVNLLADFGEEKDIKKAWELASISMDDYLQGQFYEWLKSA